MRTLAAAELLDVWEQGAGLPAVHQALLLLGTAWPERSLAQLSELSIGQRDASILSLRERTFGSRLPGVAHCPACGEMLEFVLETADIMVVQADSLAPQSLSCRVDTYQIQFRLPNSLDVTAVSTSEDVAQARQHLLERCITNVVQEDAVIEVSALPEPVLATVEQEMAEADPQANTQLALSCPKCQHEWLAAFDIVAYFWQEIKTWAQKTLREVHLLASAYGWSESEILSMSATRRRLYLEMVYG